MLRIMLRSSSQISAIEMSRTEPPHIQLQLSSASKEFTLLPNKTVRDLIEDIQSEDRSASAIELKTIEGMAITADQLLKDVVRQSFWINYSGNQVRVFPSVL
jgi:hypothetical protein